jgi:hypothetical protein
MEGEEQQAAEVVEVCQLLESLLAVEPRLACQLGGLLGQLSRYGPSLELQAWLHRMFSLAATWDDSLLTEVTKAMLSSLDFRLLLFIQRTLRCRRVRGIDV